MNQSLGKLFIVVGVVMAFAGVFLVTKGRLPSWLGHLPGDISIKRDGFQFYFPLTTCLVLSGIVSLILALFRKR